MEDLTGKQFGACRIIAPLGEGGMAAVYKAYQANIDRYVALKVLPRRLAGDPQFINRFNREAKTLAQLQHPHILPIHDYGESGGYTYIVMPFVESGDLADLLRSKRLSLSNIRRIILQVGDALDYAHAQGVIHRDVKPSNILIDQRGNCLLTDFGIAKIVEGDSDKKLTATGGIIGTPTYMSPEQGTGQSLDGRSDIYSLGVILYEMVTGRVPYRAETPMAVMIKHINDPLHPPRALNANIPEAIERVVLKSLAKQPEDRYATAGDMTRALQAAIETSAVRQAVEAAPTALSIAAAKPNAALLPRRNAQTIETPHSVQREIWMVLGVALIVILLGLAALGGWRLFSQSGVNPAAPPPPLPSPNLSTPPSQNQLLPTAQPTQDQPSPTPSPVSQPAQDQSSPENQPSPTQPPSDSQPVQDQPASTQPPSDQSPPSAGSPPQEALAACRGVEEGANCQINTPRGTVTGVCRLIQEQLACVPPNLQPPGPR